jgi:pilus assembly protein Flp/PilA
MATFEVVKKLVVEEEGADAVEYGLLVSLIAIAIIVTVGALGTKLNSIFNYVNSQLRAS